MKSYITIVALAATLGACGTLRSGADLGPSTTSVRDISGTWVGTIAGREMVSALGPVEAPARLTLEADGRFTLTSSGGAVVSGITHPTAGGVALEGRMTAGDPMAVGRAVSFVLRPRDAGTLYGDGETFYLGHRVDAGIQLQRAG